MAAMKLAFMAIVPGSDAEKDRSVLTTEFVELITQLVPDRDAAVKKAKQLADEGCAAIELCGGFGHLGTAKVVEAVAGKTSIGVVRFDLHPVLGGKSGDEVFQ
jgi:hypothetical protein